METLPIDRSLQLPPEQYMHTMVPKTGICLHHTVGGTAASTVTWWKQTRDQVGTAYLIERDGTIYEVFDPRKWAWQFGLKAPEWDTNARIAFEQRFIGIELASVGGLLEQDGALYCFDRVSTRTRRSRDAAFDFGRTYRDTYRYFERYTQAQQEALIRLVNALCDRFDIPRRLPAAPLAYYGRQLSSFEGIIGHAMVRWDKSDPLPDERFYQTVRQGCTLEEVTIGTAAEDTSSTMTAEDLDALFEANVQELMKMAVPAGSMVKGLLMELKRDNRDTYIRLREAESSGHGVCFDVVQGDPDLVRLVARALGIRLVEPDRLEVRHA